MTCWERIKGEPSEDRTRRSVWAPRRLAFDRGPHTQPPLMWGGACEARSHQKPHQNPAASLPLWPIFHLPSLGAEGAVTVTCARRGDTGSSRSSGTLCFHPKAERLMALRQACVGDPALPLQAPRPCPLSLTVLFCKMGYNSAEVLRLQGIPCVSNRNFCVTSHILTLEFQGCSQR